ncbi:MAG: threonylcarbamoyl-AMP synthase [Spirochaetaceae bacterium]|jgi:L-threonylcarbamoyladenylate synthase|nr:threonylcarbamoyl-AMP synthase [Spirochaetaceae bacterium]
MLYLELNEKNILIAAEQLSAGKLVAFPTETVYGLGCDAFNKAALAKVFEVKKRPRFDPLIIHIAALDTLEKLVDFSRLTQKAKHRLTILSRALWPGPLTLILPKLQIVPDIATGGLDTVAVRFPAHDGAIRLIKESSGAVAAPSANPFGYLSPTRAEHVREQLGVDVDIILDGGAADIGVESTVLDISAVSPRILRPGGLPRETVEAFIGPLQVEQVHSDETVNSPGQLKSHYAPRKDLYLHNSSEMRRLPFFPDDAYLFFERSSFKTFIENNKISTEIDNTNFFILSAEGDTREAAVRLFDTLHTIDALPVSNIHAERAPESGLGAAINDRLSRARAQARNVNK